MSGSTASCNMTTTIVTYQNDPKGRYSLLRLASGERVFISLSQQGLRVSKFGWLFPTRERLLDLTLADADAVATLIERLVDMQVVAEPAPDLPLLDLMIAAPWSCRDLDAVRDRLACRDQSLP
jgi:hypothetical protein